jgi:hypothetical protein
MTGERKRRPVEEAAAVQYIIRKPRAFKDLLMIVTGASCVFVLSARFDVFNKIVDWMYHHDTWQLDELFNVAVYLVGATAIYAWRRYRELAKETLQRKNAESEKAQIVPRLEQALADVSYLKKLLPMCSSCKRVRDDRGYWEEVESYVELHFSTRVDTGLCPDCATRLYRRTNPNDNVASKR